jgi:hypothetical protein
MQLRQIEIIILMQYKTLHLHAFSVLVYSQMVT